MPNFLIDSEAQLEKFLSDIVKEAIQEVGYSVADEERNKQDQKAAELADLKNRGGGSKAEEVDEADDETEAPEQVVAKAPVDTGEEGGKGAKMASSVPKVTGKKLRRASLDDVVKMLNVLRSGRSLKGKDTRARLQDYMDGLTSGEKETLYAFITGLAEIMVAGEQGAEALDPGDAGVTIQVKATPKKKSSAPVKVQPGTPEAPIVVGERADMSRIRRRIKEIMEY